MRRTGFDDVYCKRVQTQALLRDGGVQETLQRREQEN